MKISKKIKAQMLKLCGSICADDGRDPKEFHETSVDRKNDQHRHQRLCQQVARTLALVLPESVSEPLRELRIDRVVEGRNRSVLTVKIEVPEEVGYDQRNELLKLLRLQEGWLRSEVAAAITRKRVPRFAFEFTLREINSEEISHE